MFTAKKWTTLFFPAAALLCLTPWASPGLALAAGAVLALSFHNPFAAHGRKISKYLLQACVVLLGFSMDLGTVLAAGREGLLFAAATIVTTFALGWLIARWLNIGHMVSLLVSAGTAICGGSAIAAVGAVTDAAEEEMTVAIGTVFLLNAVALYIFPPLGHALNFNSAQFGAWAGIAIHDISSVVGAASHYSTDALQTATAVKLSRALWIVPVAAIAAHVMRRIEARQHPREITQGAPAARKLQIPWFIGLFLLASIARTFVPAVTHYTPQIAHVAVIGFTLTLFMIGAGLSRATLKAVGWRPLAQGVLLWVFISTVSAATIMLLVK